MPKAIAFLKKIITLAILAFIFFYAAKFGVHLLISLPLLLLAFGLLSSKITGNSPKELFNFKRSEMFFAKGGLRDLIRMPVMLFAFLYDVFVWIFWGVYQLFEMLIDVIIFCKEILYWLFYAKIWFLKLLVPFWRLAYKLFIFYLIKWPWWIYQYAYRSLKPSFNKNVLRISLPFSFVALLLVQLFLFLEIILEIPGLRYIGIILAILPITWIFGEIASLKAQNLDAATYQDVKSNFRNGIESVRGILFFLTFFVVLLLASCGFAMLGWIPKNGIIIQGFALNFVFVINLALLFLGFIIVFGIMVLPSYRLYNTFAETSFNHFLEFLRYISKRVLQYLAGLVPASFFAVIALIPAAILIIVSLNASLKLRDKITDIRISSLKNSEQSSINNSLNPENQIKLLEYCKEFPELVLNAAGIRSQLKQSIDEISSSQQKLKSDLKLSSAQFDTQILEIDSLVNYETQKIAVNQTRLDELQTLKQQLTIQQQENSKRNKLKLAELTVKYDFVTLKYRQLPAIIYLGGLFMVVVLALAFTFIFAYFGNFFYASFVFRNDGSQSEWKSFVQLEQLEDSKQPLLSTSLSIILLAIITLLIKYLNIV